jgi:ribosomal protein S18 acetylase RimI-like enzyme
VFSIFFEDVALSSYGLGTSLIGLIGRSLCGACAREQCEMAIEPEVFTAMDGRKVVLRSVRWEDLDDLLGLINSLVDEGVDIVRTEKVTRNGEAEWLGGLLARIEKREIINCAAEVEGKVIANSEIGKREGPMSHVGGFGIAIKQGYRGIGIGTRIMQTLVEESKKAGLRMLVLEVFDTNEIAKHLYQKMSFKEAGRIPKGVYKNGNYVDLIRMTLEL